MIMKKLIHILILPLLMICGCDKMLEVSTPPNAVYASAVFTASVKLKSAVLGMYSGLLSSQTYGYCLIVLNSLYVDETTSNSFTTYVGSSLISSDSYVAATWSDSYSGIYRANAILEGVQSAPFSEATKQQAMGEAYFVRAYCHFMLINFFSNIPIITSTNAKGNAVIPQASTAEVYQQITDDLNKAIALLPDNYSVSGNERTQANKLVATALLAKVYMARKDWANAETQSAFILNNSLFSLPADLSTVFTNTSTEAIFQLNTGTTGYTSIASFYIPSTGAVPSFSLVPEFMDAFETGDLRKSSWTSTSAGYGYPTKYKVTRSGTGIIEYPTLLRLADIMLVHAEACARQDKISDAQKDINAIRQRAGLGNTGAADQSSLLLAIEQERRVEMFCEYADRLFHLKRTGRIDAVLGAKKSGWKSTAADYPIPAAEISKNNHLVQNPGY